VTHATELPCDAEVQQIFLRVPDVQVAVRLREPGDDALGFARRSALTISRMKSEWCTSAMQTLT
jgi:hypothetical protein